MTSPARETKRETLSDVEKFWRTNELLDKIDNTYVEMDRRFPSARPDHPAWHKLFDRIEGYRAEISALAESSQ